LAAAVGFNGAVVGCVEVIIGGRTVAVLTASTQLTNLFCECLNSGNRTVFAAGTLGAYVAFLILVRTPAKLPTMAFTSSMHTSVQLSHGIEFSIKKDIKWRKSFTSAC